MPHPLSPRHGSVHAHLSMHAYRPELAGPTLCPCACQPSGISTPTGRSPGGTSIHLATPWPHSPCSVMTLSLYCTNVRIPPNHPSLPMRALFSPQVPTTDVISTMHPHDGPRILSPRPAKGHQLSFSAVLPDANYHSLNADVEARSSMEVCHQTPTSSLT